MMSWFKGNIVFIVLILLGIFAGVGSFIYMGNLLEPHHQQVEKKQEEPIAKVHEPDNKEENKASEKWLELPRKRNLVVLIDNDIKARPQAGLKEADLIYELPIEGGTTRFMAVYSRFSSELIGPIRSARAYTIELAKEYDPIFVHAGGSPLAFAMFDKIGNLNGLEGGVDYAFWRIIEREAPHNLYSDTKTLRRVAIQQGFREQGQLPDFKYLDLNEKFAGKKADKISINYGHDDFRAEYLYDKKSLKYLRFTGGVKHWANDGDQLAATNIIIQMVNTKVMDDEGRLKIDLIGRGKAVFFSEGQVIQGFWEKKTDGITKYYQAEGEEVALTPGKTWINIVPVHVKVEY